jgi:hypothetical protein
VDAASLGRVESILDGIAHAVIGHVDDSSALEVVGTSTARERAPIDRLQSAWNAPTGG